MHYFFTTPERLYFVMPLIVGGDLSVRLKQKNDNFSEHAIKFYITQVLLGLKVLHNNNLIHRDLKLQNLMIDERGFLKIIDFGISRKLGTWGEKSTTFCGTAEYIAPEVIMETGYSFSADIWSVGILMYEMRFGVTPFKHQNKNIQNSQICNEPLNWPSQARQPRSAEFEQLVSSLLNKDKTGRPQTPDEVLEHDWFPKGAELEAIAGQVEDIQSVLSEETWGTMPPIVPAPVDENDESTWEHFDLKKGSRALKETVLST